VMYACRKISAKDFAIACFHCTAAKVPGADFDSYAAAPGQSSDGNYQKAIDKVILPFSPLYWINTPVMPKTRAHREVRAIPMNPLHEAIATEIRSTTSLLDDIATRTWPPCYNNHPLVQEARTAGTQLPIPLAVYLDGVRFTAPIAGRSDSILGIWAYNACSGRRHYLMSLRTRDFCRCGCRGWCTIYPTMLALSWCLSALACGKRPAMRHDLSQWRQHDPMIAVANSFGEDLGFTAILIWLKGDWGEVHHTLGLPSVAVSNCPCVFCRLPKNQIHEHYGTMNFPPQVQTYDEMCREREVSVVLITEIQRQGLLRALVFNKGRRGHGRELRRAVVIGGVPLRAGDRLEPGPALPDTMLVDSALLPIVVTFWRQRYDDQRRPLDPVVHRNPLFNSALHNDPSTVLAIDTLHTVYYGPVSRWTSATLWRILLSNPWRLAGSQEDILDMGLRRMKTHLLKWFDEAGIPHNRRISDLTLQMLGDQDDFNIGGDLSHHGSSLKTKAAETSVLMDWEVTLLQYHGQRVASRDELLAGGKALQRWLEITRTDAVALDDGLCQELLDCAQRHLSFCKRAGVKHIPKHHFFAELSSRARFMGNPKTYSCFLDESLNLVLRNVAAASHRAKQEERIFTHFSLLGSMGWHLSLFGSEP
jgi:hypothetical protein